MTDLEIMRLCAEAMGIVVQHTTGEETLRFPETLLAYNPLHDDAQAMALVKRFFLIISPQNSWSAPGLFWSAEHRSETHIFAHDKDLNRAICAVVAKMQAAKA